MPPPIIACLDHAELADVAALRTLEAAAFPGDAYLHERLETRQFRHLIRHGHAELPVLRGADGGLLGYAALLYRRRSTSARLYSLAVPPAYQGVGLGALLVAWCESLAAARGCSRMLLEALASNTTLLRFYHAQGYTLQKLLPGYYSGGQDGLRLVKALPDIPPIRTP